MANVLPPRLYHYQRFDAEHLNSLLIKGTIKLSRPDSFNDPWDCRLRYLMPTDDAERRSILLWFSEMHRKLHPQISEGRRALTAFGFRSDPAKLDAAILAMEKQMYAAICQQYRVYCLTEKPDSQLMWSHYAAAHSGICLEFDATEYPFRASTKVEYLTKYPAYDLVTVEVEPLIAKSADWAYEAEWRLVAEERAVARSPMTVKTDADFLNVPQGALKSIIVGMRADNATKASVRSLVETKAPEVLVRQATRSLDRYEVEIDPPIV